MKDLEFSIVDKKILEVSDFSWYIDLINAIYIARNSCCESILMPNYSIFIKSKFDLVELYYKSSDEIKISNEFKKLCNAIKEVNPNFEMCFPYCFNMKNVKDIDFSNHLISGDIKISFENDEINLRTSKKFARQFAEKLDENNTALNQ